MKLKLVLVLFCIGFILHISCSQEQGKHLFILSGQSNMVRLNPEESFIPTLEKAYGKNNIVVVKDAMGSQPISRWYKNWKSSNGEIPKQRGDLYNRLLEKVRDSVKNQKIASVTFIWMQGERDARMKWADVYEQSLIGLYNQLSEDLNRTDINLVIGRLNDFDMANEKWPHWTKIRDIQVKVGNSNTRFEWVNTDDLNDGFNPQGKPVNNDLHMSVSGFRILGERFANKSIQLIYDNKHL